MCSGYFVERPEVVFQENHPQLFVGQPVWLYQAAVCQKCNNSLETSRREMLERSPEYDLKPCETTTTTDTTGGGTNRQENEQQVADEMEDRVTSADSATSAKNKATILRQEQTSVFNEAQVNVENETSNSEKLVCCICLVALPEHSNQAILRRSRFPTLLSNPSEHIGPYRACNSCYRRLNQQRDRFIKEGISEECRDYVSHIRNWTSQGISNKGVSSKTKTISTCFVCDKFLPATPGSIARVYRSKFPQIFENIPRNVVHFTACVGCKQKLQKLHLKSVAASEGHSVDVWAYINNLRERKGLPQYSHSS